MHSKKRRLRPNDAEDGNFLHFFVCIIVLAVRITFVSNRHTRAGIQKPSDGRSKSLSRCKIIFQVYHFSVHYENFYAVSENNTSMLYFCSMKILKPLII